MSYYKKHDAQEVTSLSGGTIYSGSTDLSLLIGGGGGGPTGAGLLSSFGLSSISTSSASANSVLALKFLCAADITVNTMAMFVSSTGSDTVTLGIYDDQLVRITQSAPTATNTWTAGELEEVTVPQVQLTGGEVYWLALKGTLGSLNFGVKTTLTNAALCRSLFYGSTGLPPTLGGSANSIAPFIYVKN